MAVHSTKRRTSSTADAAAGRASTAMYARNERPAHDLWRQGGPPDLAMTARTTSVSRQLDTHSTSVTYNEGESGLNWTGTIRFHIRMRTVDLLIVKPPEWSCVKPLVRALSVTNRLRRLPPD